MRELQALRLESVEAKAQSDILQERTTLIDMLTHELKTPLGTIKFALASLQRDHAAHANSVAKIPSPAKTIRIPGPGPTKAIAPKTVIKPPIKPIITRQTRRPIGVFLNQVLILIFFLFLQLVLRKRHLQSLYVAFYNFQRRQLSNVQNVYFP